MVLGNRGITSTMKLRIMASIGLVIGLAIVGAVAPVSPDGTWSTNMVDCMCHSKNYVILKEGEVFLLSEHYRDRKDLGPYKRVEGVWKWEIWNGRQNNVVEIHATLFFIKFVDTTNHLSYTGFRAFYLWGR